VKLVDPNGEEIVIHGEDGDFIFILGGECSSTDWKVKEAWKHLNDIYSTKPGERVIGEMIKDGSPTFILTDESLHSDETGRFKPDGKKGGTLYMGGELETIGYLAHELFHGYQEMKGQGGNSIHNEVEAYLFSSLYSNKSINGLNCRNMKSKAYFQSVQNLLFTKDYNNFDSDFKQLVSGFKKHALANINGLYESMPLRRDNQKINLFKQLVQ